MTAVIDSPVALLALSEMDAIKMDSDETLIARALDGQLAAFEELLERHRDVVFRVAARIVPSLSTSGETLTIEESMNLEGETGERRNVGDEHEWSYGSGCRRARRPASRRRAGIRGWRARRAGGGA